MRSSTLGLVLLERELRARLADVEVALRRAARELERWRAEAEA